LPVVKDPGDKLAPLFLGWALAKKKERKKKKERRKEEIVSSLIEI